MHLQLRPEVLSQNHTHIHPPKRVGFDYHLPRPQRGSDVARALRVSPAHDDLGGIGQRIGVAEKDHIKAMAPEHPGGGTRRALSPGSVQHLNLHPALGR